jgi:hypothetical protein
MWCITQMNLKQFSSKNAHKLHVQVHCSHYRWNTMTLLTPRAQVIDFYCFNLDLRSYNFLFTYRIRFSWTSSHMNIKESVRNKNRAPGLCSGYLKWPCSITAKSTSQTHIHSVWELQEQVKQKAIEQAITLNMCCRALISGRGM